MPTDIWSLHRGEALIWLRTLPNGHADALVTDPPAGIAFMGKGWDRDKGGRTAWVAWLAEILSEARRCLKPGAAGFVWALPRTSHWTATACEDAGFEVRDVVTHVQGQGFPKSKALLKPAAEHWILVRNPGPLRDLRIDDCRTGSMADKPGGKVRALRNMDSSKDDLTLVPASEPHPAGRWPANFIMSHGEGCELRGTKRVKGGPAPYVRSADATGKTYGDGCMDKPAGYLTHGYSSPDGTETVEDWACEADCPVRLLGEQSGERGGHGGGARGNEDARRTYSGGHDRSGESIPGKGAWGTGTAARFFPCFYQPKASKRDRGEGNGHPTVKSIPLMRWLCRLVTPAGGLVLDPFAGSGTTGVAALQEGLRFVGIEKEEEYGEIARRRIGAVATSRSIACVEPSDEV